jgi:methyl-accepting chemotaxis protein
MEKQGAISFGRRREYFIEKKFQSRFILKFCTLVIVGGLLTIGLLYLLTMQSTTVSVVNSRVVVRSTADFLLPILIQTVVTVMMVVGLATIAVTLFISHKIAGPLYRFKKIIQVLSEGDFSVDFRLRHLDQLQDIALAFNYTISKIRAELNAIKEGLLSLEKKLDSISEQEIVNQKKPILNELKTIAKDLSEKIGRFKT